jgi:hypothetical protein
VQKQASQLGVVDVTIFAALFIFSLFRRRKCPAYSDSLDDGGVTEDAEGYPKPEYDGLGSDEHNAVHIVRRRWVTQRGAICEESYADGDVE